MTLSGHATLFFAAMHPADFSNTCYTQSVILGLGVSPMRRRAFITLLGGAAVAWPISVRAQNREQMRRVAVLMGTAETPLDKANIAVFLSRLDELGWKAGRTLRTDVRWWIGTPEQMRKVIADLLTSSPDIFVVFTNLALASVQPMVSKLPVVFVGVGDPVGSGFVASLAHPGANITGFSSYDAPMGSKWLEVLKETAPHLTRVIALLHPETPSNQGFWQSIEAAAPRFGIEATAGGVHNAAEIEGVVTSFAEKPNGGLIVLPHAVTNANTSLIISLSLRHRLPSVMSAAGTGNSGVLTYYGIDFPDSFRRTAEYVDRILRGEKPADLPVQQPTKFKLVLNLKTAQAIGIEIPPIMLTRADEVIE
jgi:putative ABC transport system substrate-binding protein